MLTVKNTTNINENCNQVFSFIKTLVNIPNKISKAIGCIV